MATSMDTIRSDKLHRRLINAEFLMVKTLHGFSFRAGAGARARAREDSAPASRLQGKTSLSRLKKTCTRAKALSLFSLFSRGVYGRRQLLNHPYTPEHLLRESCSVRQKLGATYAFSLAWACLEHGLQPSNWSSIASIS